MDHPRVRSSRGQLERILDALAEAVTVTEADGRVVFANKTAFERMGVANVEAARSAGPAALLARFEITDATGRPLDPDTLPGRRLLRGEPADPALLRLVDKASGLVSWTLVKASEFLDDGGNRLAVNVLEDVTETKEQELRERFLAHAGEVLVSSIDYEETLARVADLVVPDLADWCSVEMLEGGEIRQLAVAHIDPAKVKYARELQRRFPPSLDDPTGLGAVLRTGRGEFYPTIPEDLLIANARNEDHLRVLRELQMRSAMVVPMVSREREVLGAITFVAAGATPPFDQDDLNFVEEFAARAASAVENARLYRERNERAETLQRSLLPARMPAIPGWLTATLYRPADTAGDISGDFFDLFCTEGGFTVVIGDVTGKGIQAAALTALARHSLRAAALLGLSPGAGLGLLNRMLLEQESMCLATAVVARIDSPADEPKVTVASAGHPLPLRHGTFAPPSELGIGGILLGFDSDAEWPEERVALESGDTLLFYTDGVIDAPGRRGRFGESRLKALVARCSDEPTALLEAIDRQLADFQVGDTSDDIAMLAAQLTPDRAPRAFESAAAHAAAGPLALGSSAAGPLTLG